jgi:type II secretory pathway component PulC
MPWLGHLATILALALLAWLCASIYWALSARATPSATPGLDTDPQRTAQTLASRHLFGVTTAPVTNTATIAPSDLRLNGVIAAQSAGQSAYALIAVEGKPAQVVREGDEIAPGITLQRVHAREVELLRNGQPQTLPLPQPKALSERGPAPKY